RSPRVHRAVAVMATVVSAAVISVTPARAGCPSLGVPSSFSAVAGYYCDKIPISWIGVPNATGYDLVRMNAAGMDSTTLLSNGNPPLDCSDPIDPNNCYYRYTDSNPPGAGGTVYNYIVRAHSSFAGDDCFGKWSVAIIGYTRPVPQKPDGLEISDDPTPENPYRIKLQWPHTDWATSYDVSRYDATTGQWTSFATVFSPQFPPPHTVWAAYYNELGCGGHTYGVTASNICGTSDRKL